MLKFWIKQTDNNIVNDGHRVSFQEIQEGNLDKAVMKFTEPQFHKQYIQFSDFAIRISFFRSGRYKGEKVNFVICRPTGFGSWWLNIRYLYDLKQLRVSYRRDLPNNSDRQAFKDYMTALDYQKDVSFSIGELGLTQSEPNSKVKELFDYFHNMILSARNYEEVDGENVKAMELSEKLKQNYNLILRGAPGTGKTYLAKEIAASIIGIPKEELASSDQFEFVQFHPSYDYTDFVEGLRPVQINGQVGFEPKNGTFKEFCKNALLQQNVQFDSFDNIWENFINNVDEAGEVVIPQVHSERELTYSLNSNRNLKEENVNSVHTLTKENIFRVWQGLIGSSLALSGNTTPTNPNPGDTNLSAVKSAGIAGFNSGAGGYPVGQCTSFIAGILAHNGVALNKYQHLGNDADWAGNARARGLKVDMTPTAGSVVSYKGVHLCIQLFMGMLPMLLK